MIIGLFTTLNMSEWPSWICAGTRPWKPFSDFPLRVVRYEFAEESGGAGRYRGGCGLIRSFQLTRGSATLSLLSERHSVAPSGVLGGKSGATGSHTLIRAGVRTRLAAKTTVRLEAGDIVEVRTAGGGGYGSP